MGKEDRTSQDVEGFRLLGDEPVHVGIPTPAPPLVPGLQLLQHLVRLPLDAAWKPDQIR